FGPQPGVLASASSTSSGAVRMWNIAHAGRPHPFGPALSTGLRNAASSIAINPDGRVLADGGYGGTVRLWDAASPAHLVMLSQLETSRNSSLLSSVAFDPHGHLLASSNQDGTVKLWDITDPRRPHLAGSPLTHAGS